LDLKRVVLIHPGREGRFFGKAAAASIRRELGPHDLVGITSKTLAIETAEKFGRLAHEAGVQVVAVGGAHATLMPEDVARWADAVFTGEAYFTWPQLIQDFINDTVKSRYNDTEWADLAGVARLTNRVIQQVDENRNFWTPLLEVTRGCPRNCSFCTAIRVSGQKMRFRPVEEIIEEIERRKIDRFFLTDDNFGLAFRLRPEYVEELFLALAKLPGLDQSVQRSH